MNQSINESIDEKMMQQDMSYFEEKFKRKDQARVMINVYLR